MEIKNYLKLMWIGKKCMLATLAAFKQHQSQYVRNCMHDTELQREHPCYAKQASGIVKFIFVESCIFEYMQYSCSSCNSFTYAWHIESFKTLLTEANLNTLAACKTVGAN